MLVTPACYECQKRLISQTADLAGNSPESRQRARAAGLAVLHKRFTPDSVSTRIASEAHQVIRRATANPDPFAGMKRQEIAIASRLFVDPRPGQPLDALARLAILGNAIDFFIDHDTLSRTLAQPVVLAADDLPELERKLSAASNILYIADNAGECFFDLPLLQYLQEWASTTYVVKGSPVQNDITKDDLQAAGLMNKIDRVITTGNDFVGVDLETASPEFVRAFDSADLIIAKGMGNYETISELPAQGKVFFLLKAKCRPVADSLGVPLNACVAKLFRSSR